MRAIAILFNLIAVPGIGHVAMGRWQRGLPWLLLTLAWPLTVFLHLGAMLAAVLGARLGSAVEIAFLQRRSTPNGIRALAIFGGGLTAFLIWAAALQAYVVEAFKIPSGAMIPTLRIGDHIFVSKLAYRFGEPARGDVAVFVYPCEPDKDFVKRIVGLPGDAIEVRCDVLYVNGVAAVARSLKEDCAYWDRMDWNEPWKRVDCVGYVETLGGRQHEMVFSPARRELDELRRVAGTERSYEELAGDGDFPMLPPHRLPACPEGRGGSPPQPAGRFEDSPRGPQDPAGACAPQKRYVVPPGHVFVMGDNRENSSDSRHWGPVPLADLKGKAFSMWWAMDRDEVAWDRMGDLD